MDEDGTRAMQAGVSGPNEIVPTGGLMSVTIEAVSAAVGKIYEAAYDQERWLDAVSDLRDLTGSARACIMRASPHNSQAIGTVVDPGLSSREAYDAYLRDPAFAAATAVPLGRLYRRQQLGDEGFVRRELWQDWFRPRDMYDGLVSNLSFGHDSCWLFDVQRGKNQPGYGDAEIALLDKIVPHLIRAGEIGRGLGGISRLPSVFACLPFGIMLVDADRRAGHMNAAAESLLTRPGSPLGLKGGNLVARNPRDAGRLQRLIQDTCSLHDGALPGTGGTILVQPDHGEIDPMRLVLSIAPFSDARIYGLSCGRCAMIMIRAVTPQLNDDLRQHLSAVFDLTPAEAALAAALASGRSLKEAAAQNDITFKTARSYLERIFDKTGTRQQSHLVSLLNQTQPLRSSG